MTKPEKKESRPAFGAVVNFDNMEALAVSANEYILLYMSASLQGNPESKVPGWCYASNDYISGKLRITSRGVQKMKQRLEDRDLLERDPAGNYRTTPVAYKCIIFGIKPNASHELSSPPATNLVRPPHELSSPYNTRDNTSLKGEEDIDDIMDLKNFVCGLNLQEDSMASRKIILDYIQPFFSKKWFMQQFEFCAAGVKLHRPIEEIITGWIINGHWVNVRSLSINKMAGWLRSTGKTFNTPKTQSNGRAKRKFTDDLAK